MKRSLRMVVPAFLVSLSMAAGARADELKDEARTRFDEGVTLYDQGNYEAARAKFLQAYALKKHPTVLLNLAWSSLKGGHAKDAEDYFAQYLKETEEDGTTPKREEARRGLAEARRARGGGNAPAGTVTNGGSGDKPPASDAPAPSGGDRKHAESKAEPKGTDAAKGDDAKATDSFTASHGAHPVLLGALLGFGTDNLNFGVGFRGGTYVANHVYVGGTFVYHVGQSVTVNVLGVTSKATTSMFYIGPEGGYDFDITPHFVVRPYGGIGLASFSTSGTSGAGSVGGNNTQAAFWPACAAFYAIPGSRFTVGGDMKILFIPGGPALELFASGGLVL